MTLYLNIYDMSDMANDIKMLLSAYTTPVVGYYLYNIIFIIIIIIISHWLTSLNNSVILISCN